MLRERGGRGREVEVAEPRAVDLDDRLPVARDLVPELDSVDLRLAGHAPSRPRRIDVPQRSSVISTCCGATASTSSPVLLRDEASHEREARLGPCEGVRREPDAPRAERLEPEALEFGGFAGLDVAHAEVEREPVVDLQQRVVVVPGSRLAAELRLLLGDERVDELLHLGRPGQREARVEPVALPVDARAVHRHEQTRVGVVLRDRRDARAVEREVRPNVHVEEVDRLAIVVDARRALPDGPAVVVALGGDHERRVARSLLDPRPRERARELCVVGLEHDLPHVAGVPDDHRATGSRSTPIRPSVRRCATTSSHETTSPYLASMS